MWQFIEWPMVTDCWWREASRPREAESSLRPTACCCCHRCSLALCQPNPCGWILPSAATFLQAEEKNLRKNGSLFYSQQSRSPPIQPPSHLLCFGCLPTQTKYRPHSDWWSGIRWHWKSSWWELPRTLSWAGQRLCYRRPRFYVIRGPSFQSRLLLLFLYDI